jgi:hypothetical protein
MALIGLNGGLLGSQRSANVGAASGIWTANEQALLDRAGLWTTVSDSNAATYIAAVEAADGQPLEDAVKTAINSFVVGCKADGIWTAIKASCILAGARTLSGALVPLVGTAPTNTSFVSGDYNRETGLVGNGTTKFLNSNRDITSDPQDNSHIAVYASSVSTGAFIGTDNSGTGDTFILSDSTNASWPFRHRLSTFDAGSQGTRGTNVAGLIALTRSTSTTCISRVSGTNATLTSTSTTIPSRNCGVFCRLGPSGALDYSASRLTFYSIGESLDLALLDTRVTTLINAIASAIP